jgi:hypothetical protein
VGDGGHLRPRAARPQRRRRRAAPRRDGGPPPPRSELPAASRGVVPRAARPSASRSYRATWPRWPTTPLACSASSVTASRI